jgi:hypothetical protein
MKATALILTVLAGFLLVGCGAGAKVPSHGPPERGGAVLTFTAPTTTTIANPQTGQAVRCTHHGVAAGAYGPSAGHGVGGAADGKSASATLNLTRNEDGSLAVSCRP